MRGTKHLFGCFALRKRNGSGKYHGDVVLTLPRKEECKSVAPQGEG